MQLAAMTAIQRCDDEVAKAISDIAAAENRVISELREIMLPSTADVHVECSPPHPSHTTMDAEMVVILHV